MPGARHQGKPKACLHPPVLLEKNDSSERLPLLLDTARYRMCRWAVSRPTYFDLRIRRWSAQWYTMPNGISLGKELAAV